MTDQEIDILFMIADVILGGGTVPESEQRNAPLIKGLPWTWSTLCVLAHDRSLGASMRVAGRFDLIPIWDAAITNARLKWPGATITIG